MIANVKNLTAVALLTLVAACAGEVVPGSSTNGRPNDARPASGITDGLTLTENMADRVSGRFERDGAAISFELTRHGTEHHVLVWRESGEPLLESSLVGDYDTMTYFGGRATIKGRVNGEPDERTGDDAVFQELSSSLEAQLIPSLKEALLASDVDEALVRLAPSSTLDGIAPRSTIVEGGWYVLGFRESMGFWSWSFWGVTTVTLESYRDYYNGPYKAVFQTPHIAWSQPEHVSGYGHGTYRRQWGGTYVTVTNEWVPLCDVYNPSVCQDVRMYAIAY